MHLALITLEGSDTALFVNHKLVQTTKSAITCPSLLEEHAERLSDALSTPLVHHRLPAPEHPDWTWAEVVLAAFPNPCSKCGSSLSNGYCTDLTCPYCEWPQHVPLSDLQRLTRNEIARTYGVVRGEVTSNDDDQVTMLLLDASRFVRTGNDELLLAMARSFDPCLVTSRIDRTFLTQFFADSAELKPYVDTTQEGYVVEIDTQDFFHVLCRTRYGVWARAVCSAHGHSLRFSALALHGGGTAEAPLLSLDEEAADWVRRHSLVPTRNPLLPLYLAYWEDNTFICGGRRLVGLGYFGTDMGYSPKDLADLEHLKTGDTWESPEYGHFHTICKVQ